MPCESCIRRGTADECVFDPDAKVRPEQQLDRRPKTILPVRSDLVSSSKDSKPEVENAVNSDAAMNDRIHRLEDLVLSLMNQQSLPSQDPLPQGTAPHASTELIADDTTSPDSLKQPGTLSGKVESSVYHSEGHWASILSDIAAIKAYITDGKKPFPDAMQLPGSIHRTGYSNCRPGYLFSGGDVPRLSDLRANLPSVDMIDMLMVRFLGNNDHIAPLLHGPSFLGEYQRHRNTLWDAQPDFLALLYAVMCIAMSSYHYKGDEPADFHGRTLQVAAKYRSMTEKSLLLADWSQPSRRMLQVLLLHKYGDYLKGRDANLDDWVFEGIVSISLANLVCY